MKRTSDHLTLVVIFPFLMSYFLFVSYHRLIDGDEGFYLLASRLVLDHKVPYLDFFYTQAPLLPYAYGLWIKLFGISWFSARCFSATLTTILGLLIYEHVCHHTQRWIAGVAAIIAFASSTFVFAWYPLAKTYSLSAIFIFGCYMIVSRLSPVSSRWTVAAAGLLFGLCVDTRLYVVGLMPVLLWWMLSYPDVRTEISRILWFLGGFAVGIGPCVYLFVSSPVVFLFDNLGYHAMRSDAGLIGDWKNKIYVALKVLFGAGDNGAQFSSLAALSLVVILQSRMRRDATLLAFLIACALGLISLLPTPAFVQYFCLCMPFLIVAAVGGTSEYAASLDAARSRGIAVLASAAVLAFAASSIPSFRRYLVTGAGVIGVADTHDAPNWTLEKVSAVSHVIDQLAAPNEKIASFWPGYIFVSKAYPYPGFENDFGWVVADKLTVDQRAKYHIRSRASIAGDFSYRTPRVVVLDNQENGGVFRSSKWAMMLRSHGYTAVRTIGDTSIFVCCSSK
jgi:4-amino-4-deoxy-L-arabinose transferase-like glycosyltransferase